MHTVRHEFIEHAGVELGDLPETIDFYVAVKAAEQITVAQFEGAFLYGNFKPVPALSGYENRRDLVQYANLCYLEAKGSELFYPLLYALRTRYSALQCISSVFYTMKMLVAVYDAYADCPDKSGSFHRFSTHFNSLYSYLVYELPGLGYTKAVATAVDADDCAAVLDDISGRALAKLKEADNIARKLESDRIYIAKLIDQHRAAPRSLSMCEAQTANLYNFDKMLQVANSTRTDGNRLTKQAITLKQLFYAAGSTTR